jgi:serine/threonine protein kinase
MLNYSRRLARGTTATSTKFAVVTQGKLLKKNNEIAAVKVVFLKEDEIRETLLEMEILQACKHPNITEYFGCFLKGLDLWVT